MAARWDCWNQFGSISTSYRPWNGLSVVPPGLLNFNFCLLAKHLTPDHLRGVRPGGSAGVVSTEIR